MTGHFEGDLEESGVGEQELSRVREVNNYKKQDRGLVSVTPPGIAPTLLQRPRDRKPVFMS